MTQPSNPPESLRAMLTQALQTYELAKATRLQAERKAKEEYQQRLKAVQAEQQAEIRELEAEQKRETAAASAEQERLGHLLSAIEQVEQSAHDLLGKAGLAHIAGAPLRVEDGAAKSRYSDQAVATAFSAAQTAYVELRAALLRLAQTYTDAEQWEEARRVLQPLLNDTQAPLYTDACNLLHEIYYNQATAYIARNDRENASRVVQLLQKEAPNYKGVFTQLCTSYEEAIRQSLAKGQTDQAMREIEGLLAINPKHPDVQTLRYEIILRQEGIEFTHKGSPVSVDFSPDAEKIALAFKDALEVRAVHSGESIGKLNTQMYGVVFSPDGAELVGNQGGSFYRYRTQAVSSGGEYITSGFSDYRPIVISPDGSVSVWQRQNSLRFFSLTGELYYDDGSAIAFSPDGKHVAIGRTDGDVRLTRRENIVLGHGSRIEIEKILQSGEAAPVGSLAFDLKGMLLASAHTNGRITVWETKAGSEFCSFAETHRGKVNHLLFISNLLLASAGEDGIIRLWDLRCQKSIVVLEMRSKKYSLSPVLKLAYKADKRLLLAIGENCVLRAWDLESTLQSAGADPNLLLSPSKSDEENLTQQVLKNVPEYLEQQAQVALARGHWQEAFKLADQIAAISPNHTGVSSIREQAKSLQIRHLFDKAQEALTKEQGQEALRIADQLMAISPDHPDIARVRQQAQEIQIRSLLQKARDALTSGDLKKAGDLIRQLLSQSPKHPEVVKLQTTYEGNLEAQLAVLHRQAEAIIKEASRDNYYSGYEAQQALTIAYQMAQLSPSDGRIVQLRLSAHYAVARYHLYQSRWTDALTAAAHMEQLSPNDPRVREIREKAAKHQRK